MAPPFESKMVPFMRTDLWPETLGLVAVARGHKELFLKPPFSGTKPNCKIRLTAAIRYNCYLKVYGPVSVAENLKFLVNLMWIPIKLDPEVHPP